jgi:hypothetical protein
LARKPALTVPTALAGQQTSSETGTFAANVRFRKAMRHDIPKAMLFPYLQLNNNVHSPTPSVSPATELTVVVTETRFFAENSRQKSLGVSTFP